MSESDPLDTAMIDMPLSTSISEAAQQYQMAMSQQEGTAQAPTVDANTFPPETTVEPTTNGNTVETIGSPSHGSATTANAPSPAPMRTGTPVRREQAPDVSSRAVSQHPEIVSNIPVEAQPHGAPTRQYLNSKVTVAVMEGMKLLAKEQPKDPLRFLGDFLLQRSKDIEGA